MRELLGYENFDADYLQSVVEFLYFKNGEIKLNDKRFQIGGRIQERVEVLRGQIEEQETAFIQKFRLKSLKDLIKVVRGFQEL